MRSLIFVPLLALAISSLAAADSDSFQVLARDINDESLHAALHENQKYKHGIFPGDRHALEAMRREKEEEAIRIVKLAKRQSNSTSTATTLSVTSTSRTTSSSTTTSINDQDSTTTITSSPSTTSTSNDISTSLSTFMTRRVTTVTEDDGEVKTITTTEVVVVTPTRTPTQDRDSTSTTTKLGLQTDDAVSTMDKLEWIHVGMIVVAGVGGWVL